LHDDPLPVFHGQGFYRLAQKRRRTPEMFKLSFIHRNFIYNYPKECYNIMVKEVTHWAVI